MLCGDSKHFSITKVLLIKYNSNPAICTTKYEYEYSSTENYNHVIL